MEPTAFAVDGLTVTGERSAALRAINEQRSLVGLANVIAGDEIGKLPDQNVAEAVQRVPGVTMQTSRGEGRFVSIRGTAPELNNVTLNGQTLASTAGSRATALDLLPASMVSSVEVVKSVTPDMDANAVGGTVNIKTVTAFDRERPFFFGSFEGIVADQAVAYLDDKFPFEANFTAGRRFGPAQSLGIVVSGSANRRDFAASVLDPDGWQDLGSNQIFPEELELQVEDNERQRYGLSTNLDWRPSESTSLYLRGLYTHTREVTFNSEFEYGLVGDPLMVNGNLAEFGAGSLELDLSNSDETENLLGTTLGAEQRWGDVTWEVSGTYTRGTLDEEGPDATFETDDADEPLAAAMVDIGGYFFDITPTNPGFVDDPTGYPLRSADLQYYTNTENTYGARTDLRYDTRLGNNPASLKVGAKLQQRDKVIDDLEYQYEPLGIVSLEPFYLPNAGTVQGGAAAAVHGDVGRWRDYILANVDDAGQFELNQLESALEAIEGDSDNRERIVAGYVMGEARFGRLTALAGARVERTDTKSLRYEISVDEDTEEANTTSRIFDTGYTNVLPSVILKVDATHDVVLRGAWTNSIGRPDYEEIAGFRLLEFEETSSPGVYAGGIEEGNPDLKPYEASNLDVSAEYYLDTGGLLSAGYFYKRIDNPIFVFQDEQRDVDFEGRFFEELNFEQVRNADAGTISGVELSWSQPLVFLPYPLDGLGLSANAAFIGSSVDIPGREREDLPFFGQSDQVYNLVPYYQRGPLELRFAWAYQNEYLIEVGDEPFEDRYFDSRATIDVSGRYAVTPRVTLFAQARNVTDEPEVGYQGIRSRYDVHTVTGRSFSFGLSASY
jgi:TonB-dependent receptor